MILQNVKICLYSTMNEEHSLLLETYNRQSMLAGSHIFVVNKNGIFSLLATLHAADCQVCLLLAARLTQNSPSQFVPARTSGSRDCV